MGGGRFQSRDVEERVDGDPAKLHSQLGPGGHAVDVPRIRGSWQSADLIPCPGSRMRDKTLDRERPRRQVELGGDLRGQYGPLVPCVILTRREPGISGGFPATKESSCRLCHVNSLLRLYGLGTRGGYLSYLADYFRLTPRDWVAARHRSPLTV